LQPPLSLSIAPADAGRWGGGEGRAAKNVEVAWLKSFSAQGKALARPGHDQEKTSKLNRNLKQLKI